MMRVSSPRPGEKIPAVRLLPHIAEATAHGREPVAVRPITTVAGMHLGNLLGGAAVIETVFSWPGLGRLALEAVQGRDYNVLLGVLLLSSLLVIIANVLVDLLHAWLDPRIMLH